jgi:hypothetical protein
MKSIKALQLADLLKAYPDAESRATLSIESSQKLAQLEDEVQMEIIENEEREAAARAKVKAAAKDLA